MKIIFSIIITILIVVFGLALYLNVFTTMNVEEKETGGFKVVGIEFTGPYSEAGKHMMEVDEKFKNMGINSSKGFGIYYDDPKTTPSEKCRSFVGNVLEGKDIDRISELKTAGFRVDSVPISNAVVTEFPAKTSLSYMIGPMKAYPALSKYMSKKKYTLTLSLEIYDVPGKHISYIMQFKK